jgi:hypothetical protein
LSRFDLINPERRKDHGKTIEEDAEQDAAQADAEKRLLR